MTYNYLSCSKMLMLFFLVFCMAANARAQSNAVADGPGNTYEQLDAFGYKVETPDCGHPGRHINEVMDAILGKYVFAFTLHRDLDDDRCGETDRQRVELRGKGPDQQGTQGSTSHYRWKFKLDAGFQPSPSFTHIMQLKAYDNGHGSGSPILHLTPRHDNKMEIGHPTSGGVKASADLSLFRGVWVEAYVKIKHDNAGTLQFIIKRLSDGVTLLSYTNNNIDMWEDGAGYGAPKFGFYRSLNNISYLRDETVYLADICVAKSVTDLCPSDIGSNAAPTVSLTAPASGATYTAPANITVSANAADSDGSISKVEFYQGTTRIGEATTSPYSISWSNVAAGTYSITAKATDNDNASTTSATVSVTVNALPSCVPAVASTDDGNVAANVLDNDLNTRWSASGDPQWIQFCLNTAQTVTGVEIAFYNGNVRASRFDIQVSQNGTTWTNAATGLQSSGTTLALELFPITPQTAKYVRILGHGNTVNAWNSYTEVKINTATTPACVPVSASADDGNVPANVMDNNPATRWSASGNPQWIQFCLSSVQTVSGVQIAFYSGDVRISYFDILLSQDGTTWTNAALGLQSSGTTLNAETFSITPQSAKYVRIAGHGNSVNAWNSYTEVDIITGSALQSIAAAKLTADVTLDAPELSNYPNPFQQQTNVSFTLNKAGKTRLAVLNMQGRPVSVIADGMLQKGKHVYPLNGAGMQAGTYILILQHQGKSISRKIQKL